MRMMAAAGRARGAVFDAILSVLHVSVRRKVLVLRYGASLRSRVHLRA